MEEIKNVLEKIPSITLIGEHVKNDLRVMIDGYDSFENLKRDLPDFYINGGGFVYNRQINELWEKHPESFSAYRGVKRLSVKPLNHKSACPDFWEAYVKCSQFHIEALVKLVEAKISGKKLPEFLSPEVFEINSFYRQTAVKDLKSLYAFYLRTK